MWLIIPLLVLALVVLLLVATAALIFAVAVHVLPFLLILVGVWLLVRALRGPRHHERPGPSMRPQTRRERRHAPRPPVQEQPAGRRSEQRPPRELPIDVQVKVEQIRRKADVLLGYADRFPPFSQDLYIVRQTAAEYLPRTIAAYQAVPGVDDPALGAVGQTALDELRAQLRLLDSRLDDIAQDLQRQDLDHLVANRRFLEERFSLRERESRTDPPRQETDTAASGAVAGSS